MSCADLYVVQAEWKIQYIIGLTVLFIVYYYSFLTLTEPFFLLLLRPTCTTTNV